MCKKLLRFDGQQRSYSKAKLPLNLNCGQKIISEMGPWAPFQYIKTILHGSLHYKDKVVSDLHDRHSFLVWLHLSIETTPLPTMTSNIYFFLQKLAVINSLPPRRFTNCKTSYNFLLQNSSLGGQVNLFPSWQKMVTISQTIFSNGFLWMKNFAFSLKFHWSVFLRVLLTIF